MLNFPYNEMGEIVLVTPTHPRSSAGVYTEPLIFIGADVHDIQMVQLSQHITVPPDILIESLLSV